MFTAYFKYVLNCDIIGYNGLFLKFKARLGHDSFVAIKSKSSKEREREGGSERNGGREGGRERGRDRERE